MKMIACCDKRFGIGYKKELLLHSIPEYEELFKKQITDKILICSGTMFISICKYGNIKSMLDRCTKCIILTKKNTNKINSILRKAISLPEVILPYPDRIWFCKDIQETLNDVEILDESPKKENTIVIGGKSIYRQLIPLCDELYLTVIHCKRKADIFFPIELLSIFNNLIIEQDYAYNDEIEPGNLIRITNIKIEMHVN